MSSAAFRHTLSAARENYVAGVVLYRRLRFRAQEAMDVIGNDQGACLLAAVNKHVARP